MKSLINKTVAILILIVLIGFGLMNDAVYATNVFSQDAETQRVFFNVNVNNSKSIIADISQELTLGLNIGIKNSGYLKDAKVSVSGNNYELGEITDSNIIKITNNEISFKEIDAGKSINIGIPIKFNKEQSVASEYLNKESEVKLTAIYVDEEGKENQVEEINKVRVEWKQDSNAEISQKLIRYIKYENKTLVSFEITDGIKDNTIPVTKKEISLVPPTINNQTPVKVIVSSKDSTFKYENGVVVINKYYTPNEQGKYSWNSQDTYTVTYIYNTQTESQNITSQASTKQTTIKNEEKQAVANQTSYEVLSEIGNIIDFSVSGTTELNKGYLYTNSLRDANKLETKYDENININVGASDIIDKIELSEVENTFEDEQGGNIKNANDSITVKKVSINENELKTILGEDGRIIVKNENNEEVATLTKNALEKEITAKRITIETSNPILEGNLEIHVEKAINGETTLEEAKLFKKLNTRIESKGYKEAQIISNNQKDYKTNFEEPKSKAELSISTNRLSTVTENNNVVFNIVLNKKEITDALYKNPAIKLTLPEEVTNIEVTSAQVLYEDEIQTGSIEVNGREILVKLEGTQTQYNSSTTTNGTLIRIDTNLKLNNLSPSDVKNVDLEYTNELTGEYNKISKEIEIIAPTGFVTTNSIKIDDKVSTAIENNADLIRVKENTEEKTMQVSATVVNNLGQNADGFTIVGRIPFKGNKTLGGTELDSNIDTTLTGPIQVMNLENAIVYYSANGEENIDGSGWSTEYAENAKSFKIVNNSALENKKFTSFLYEVKIPSNLGYEKQAKESYGVYYNNNAEEGNTRNLIESKTVGIKTGTAPSIKAEISAKDTNNGNEIQNQGNAKEGEYISYMVKVSNIGNNDISNVNLKVTLPEEINLVYEQPAFNTMGGFIENIEAKQANENIENIKAGEVKEFSFNAKINQIITDDESQNKNLTVNCDVTSDNFENVISASHTVKNEKGLINVKLSSNSTSAVQNNDEIIYLLEVEKVNYDETKNVIAKLRLPKEVKYKEYIATDKEYDVSYNETDNTVIAKIGKLENSTYIYIVGRNTSNNAGELKAQATITCDELAGEEVSNISVIKNEGGTLLTASLSSNMQSNILDTDTIELYAEIKNNSNTEQLVNYKDTIPTELRVKNFTISVNGEKVNSMDNVRYLNEIFSIPKQGTATVTITVEPYKEKQGENKRITIKPEITYGNGLLVQVEELSLEFSGTRKESNTFLAGENREKLEESHKIAGRVWLDNNKNGKDESTEEKISNITLALYNSDTKEIVKDKDNNELTTQTNKNGEYTFNDVKNGNYIIVARFDDTSYEVSSYKIEGLTESENNDFTQLDNIASTDVLKVNGNNIYNVDLGLKVKDVFDLKVENTIQKATIINKDKKSRVIEFNNSNSTIELSNDEFKDSVLYVEYKISVSNNGNVEGYANSIAGSLPEKMTFNADLNKDWYLTKEGNLYSVSLSNEKIKPGETKELTLVLSKRIDGENDIVRERTEIETSYNEKGIVEQSKLSAQTYDNNNSNLIIKRKSILGTSVVILGSIFIITVTGIAIFLVINKKNNSLIKKILH